jgi:large subunit ribosomal protein L32
MAVPKRRTSKSRQGTRRSHHRVTPKGIQYCAKCNEPVLPHRICAACGNYQGREALVVKSDETEGK